MTALTPALLKILRTRAEQGDGTAAVALALADVAEALREGFDGNARALAEGFEEVASAWRDEPQPPPPEPTHRDRFGR